jgi:CubicO group peptidase (beta-lactamase class C family)
MKKQILLIVLLSTLFFSCWNKNNATQTEKAFNEKTFDSFNKTKLDSLFDVLYQNKKFMGSISLSHEGIVVYSKGIGFDDIETQKLSTSETRYRIGSVSKMFTAVLVFKAIEENKVSLNQTIDKYFPRVENASKITVGNLLNHRSGIHSFTKDKAFFDYRTEYKSSQEMVDIIASYKSDFEPDSQGAYSNSNYLLLSVMLEELYDMSFKDLLAEKIFKPLNLKHTYHGSKINLENNESNSYQYTTEWTKQIDTHLSTAMGGGSIISTPNDLNKFIEVLLNEKIISKVSLDKMTAIKDNFGMGIFEFTHSNKTGFGHGGNIEGFRAISIYYTEENLALAIASNAIDYDMDDLVTNVLKCYFNEPFELPNFEKIEIAASDLEKYVGIYAGVELSGKFNVTIENNTLHTQLNDLPKEPLVYKGNHTFTNEEIGADFIFNLQENKLRLKQGGVADIYTFNKQ